MAKLSELIANGRDITQPKRAVEPASQVKMADLLEQLKRPELRPEPTPYGTTTRDVNAAHNQHILDRVNSMREQLAERRGEAREAFNLSAKRGVAVEAFRRARGI